MTTPDAATEALAEAASVAEGMNFNNAAVQEHYRLLAERIVAGIEARGYVIRKARKSG